MTMKKMSGLVELLEELIGERLSLDRMTPEQMVEWRKQLEAAMGAMSREVWEIDNELLHRMLDEGASRLPCATADIKLSRRFDYDDSKLEPLKDLLSDQDLSRVYTPAHEVTIVKMVKAKWNKTPLRSLLTYGGEIAECIEWARLPVETVKIKYH